MGILGRKAVDLAEPVPRRAPLRVLRADGQRIDLKSKDVGATLTATRSDWQQRAYDYRDMIGELRYAVRLLARQVAQVRFYPAAIRPWPQDPAPLDGDDHGLDPQLVADALANFKRIPLDNHPDGFTARIVENLSIAGEVWIHIDAEDTFAVRSVSEVQASQDGRVSIHTLPSATAATTKRIDPETDELLRLWTPHPEWAALADSPLRTLLEVAEDVVLAGREARAAARSRIAANGLLLVPAGMSLATAREDDDEGDGLDEDTFLADFTEAMLAPVRDDGEPQAVVPIVMRGEIEDLDKVRHLTFQRADSASLVERQSAALMRLLKSLDVQPEQVEGMGGVNHWTGWIINSQSIKDQVKPMGETVAACLLQAYLIAALESLGHPRDKARQITIVADVADLAENPNRGQDARDAHDRFGISDAALIRELGFDPEDAPDNMEIVRRMATSGKLSVADAAQVLGVKGIDEPPDKTPVTVDGEVVPAPTDAARPAARPGEIQAESPVPDTQPDPSANPSTPAVTAAATPGLLRVDPDISRRLADIDAALVDRILVAADAALARVVERAGARVRSAAQKDKSVVASIAGLDAARIPAALGRERVEAYIPARDLVADEHARLRTQVMGWLDAAAQRAGGVACEILGLDPRSTGRDLVADVVSRLLAGREEAWAEFAQALADAAEDALFDPDASALADEPGEKPTGLLAADDVTALLTSAGGLTAAGRHRKARARHRLPDGGFATGPVIVSVLAQQGAVLIGREWSWRHELARDGYEPHQDLDGFRFASWSDPELATGPGTDWVGGHFHPGDHRGCRCVASPLWAVPADPEVRVGLKAAGGDPAQMPTAGRGARLRERVMAAVTAVRAQVLGRTRR